MDTDLIKSLIDALEASSLAELEYSAGGFTLRLVKSGVAPLPAAASRATASMPRTIPPDSGPAVPMAVTAPMFGTVHLSRSPGLPPFVEPGQWVATGQVLCLIEAMKVFTELRAEQDGAIAEVLVETGQEVEPGQALFRLA